MATGSGKTIVMAMVIAWHILNKVTYPQDTRFSKNVLVVAPGLTVKSRLAVLEPSHPANYYEAFRIVPDALMETLRQGRVIVRNWHALNWESEEKIRKKRSVDKRGAKSNEAYVRDVLGDMASAQNILVINDEAHHAWRVPAESKIKGVSKDEIEEATKWVGGLDRINQARGVLTAYDFSATPFAPSGKKSSEEALFGWIVSDFGLNDAIESGLVKTPRVVVRDDAMPDAKTYKSRLYHIYNDPEVKDDLNRRAEPEEPLPDLVHQRLLPSGLRLAGDRQGLGRGGFQDAAGHDHRCQPDRDGRPHQIRLRPQEGPHRRTVRSRRTLHIDSKVLDEAEAAEEPIWRRLKQRGTKTARRTEDGEPEAQADEEAAGGTAAAAGRYRRAGGQARRADSERDFGRDALGRLGRQDRDAHHGPARLHQPASVRAGRRPRPAAHRLRAQPGDGPVRSGIRQHLRRAVHLPAARVQGRRRSAPRRNPRRRSSRTRPRPRLRSPGRTSSASITSTGPACPSIGTR